MLEKNEILPKATAMPKFKHFCSYDIKKVCPNPLHVDWL